MNDTDPKIAELVRRRLLERPGAERILMGSQMFCLAKAMVLASFPEGLSEIEIKRRLCQRFYGTRWTSKPLFNTCTSCLARRRNHLKVPQNAPIKPLSASIRWPELSDTKTQQFRLLKPVRLPSPRHVFLKGARNCPRISSFRSRIDF